VTPGIPCFLCENCIQGQDDRCSNFVIFGTKQWGGYAEKVKVSSRYVLKIPDTLSFEESAAFPLSYLTAWHMLITRAALQKGERVLVIGASSGIGSAAIQISKWKGASVLATVTSTEKMSLAKQLGADAVVNSTEQSITHMARAWTDKKGVDVVFEHVGPATWEQSIGSLAPGGRLVTCGATTGPEVKIDLRYIFSRQLSILGSRLGKRQELESILSLIAKQELKPTIAKIFPQAKAAEALQTMLDRKHFGKILLTYSVQ